MPISVLVWVCSFIEPDFLKAMYCSGPFDNIPLPIYLFNLLWKLGLDSRVALF